MARVGALQQRIRRALEVAGLAQRFSGAQQFFRVWSFRRRRAVDERSEEDWKAELSPEAARPDLYRAGAIAVAAGLTGELEQDRGHIGWLSRLWEYAGEPEQAAAVLAPALERWPDDMTFHEDRAALALRTGDVETAMHEGRFAVELGLGDNRLRVLATYARALDAAGRTEEARQLVSDVLANTPPPPEALNVRTPRYLKALAELPFMVASPTEP